MHGARTVLVASLTALSLCSCRSKQVPEPSSTHTSDDVPAATPTLAAPAGRPHFSWKAPRSIPVQEDIEKQGQKQQVQFVLDVCPATDGTLLVTQRDLHLTLVGGVPTASALSPAERQQVEIAASELPTMIVDRAGSFVGVTGIDEMVARLARAVPGLDLSALRSGVGSAATRTALQGELATRWLDWVGLWQAYDPSQGASQAVTVDGGAASTATTIDLKGSSDGRVKLRAHRSLTASDLGDLVQALGPLLGDAGVDMNQVLRGGDSVMDVDTEWPELRPRHAHMRTSIRFVLAGQEQTMIEDHTFLFDWKNATDDARCSGGQ